MPVPPHLSYPSNHAFQCYSIALVFERYFPQHPATEEMHRAAKDVSENREWAGLHFESDTTAGKKLAELFLPYLVDACAEQMRAALAEWI